MPRNQEYTSYPRQDLQAVLDLGRYERYTVGESRKKTTGLRPAAEISLVEKTRLQPGQRFLPFDQQETALLVSQTTPFAVTRLEKRFAVIGRPEIFRVAYVLDDNQIQQEHPIISPWIPADIPPAQAMREFPFRLSLGFDKVTRQVPSVTLQFAESERPPLLAIAATLDEASLPASATHAFYEKRANHMQRVLLFLAPDAWELAALMTTIHPETSVSLSSMSKSPAKPAGHV